MSSNPTNSQTLQPPKLLDQLRGETRLLRSSKRTEDAAVDWATKFIVFHGRPQEVASGISQGVCPLSESGIDGKETPTAIRLLEIFQFPPGSGHFLLLLGISSNIYP